MERLYKKINNEFEASEDTASLARSELVKLQQGDPENLAIWKEMIDLSLREFEKVYDRLGVKFDHILGESYYNSALKGLFNAFATLAWPRSAKGPPLFSLTTFPN